ncbi:MAG: hypothetical protein WBK28_02340 [Minisyncoccia bacterium]
MRRPLLIIVIVLALILIGVAIYFVFFRPSAPGIVADDGPLFGDAGDFLGGGGGTGTPSDEFPQQIIEEVAPRLVKITDGPVAYGVVAMNRTVLPVGSTTASSTQTLSKTSVTEVRYVERKSGNIYSYDSKDRVVTRISNKTLPGITEAAWLPDGSQAFLRFLTENEDGVLQIETYALPAEGEDGGYFLETDLDQVLVFGSSTVVTLLPNSNGSIATMARADGALPRTLFSSLLSALRLYEAGSGFVAYTKASAELEGYGFLIDGTSGAFERALGPLRGLTLLPSPSGKLILYGFLSGNAVKAELLDAITREKTALPLAALPEKCAWRRSELTIYCAVPKNIGNGWPDSWYQGVVSYSDRIWKIDLQSRTASLVLDPTVVATTDIDAVALTVDPDGDLLVFTNKKDGSLWAYDL